MSNGVKSAGCKTGKETTPAVPFEEALQNLEAIVEAMEAGDLPLETLLARFEDGTRLVKVCQAKLEEAELRVRTLEQTAAGEAVLKPFVDDQALSNE